MRRREFLNVVAGSVAGLPALTSNRSRALPEEQEKKIQESEVMVKVLGTAQDGGIPQLGCYCPNCLRAREEPGFSRLVSSLGLFDIPKRSFFLLDATPDIRRQCHLAHQRLGKQKSGARNFPQAVLLTHAHIGHYTGLMFFGYESVSTSDLPAYCSERMGIFLANNGPWSQLVNFKNISIHQLSMKQKLSLTPSLSITARSVPHRDEYSDTLGFTAYGQKKKLLYIPDIQDWRTWKKSIVEEVKKVDYALLDGTFYGPEELPGRDLSRIGHPFITTSLKLLGKLAREGKTKIYFTHLNHSNLALDPEGEARKKIEREGFRLAEEGMEFFL
ncbi:MAG: pyrroloquinoline quinone biosynthesis protein PqqB [Candidatus Aminicenantes bacterium]|nr:pyrroloquinoline quinone biosynthesis protein PqqB [Candidatus Aminicenantes bacterium]